MKKLFILVFLFTNFSILSFAENLKFEQIVNLKDPWGSSFINNNEIIITEKSGKIKIVNINSKEVFEVKHNLNFLEIGQGGLLDIIYENHTIWISYTEQRGNWKTSTSIAKAKFNKELLNFKNIFQANPPIDSGYHFGSRLAIKGDYLYASAGERGQGMIAQDPTKHPGSIIRIYKDGSIPKDNPKFQGRKNWLPEIYQIGVRNPQGMDLDPLTNKVFISNHGPKGGDFIGEVKKGSNYGWKKVAWGGKNYSGTKVGEGNAWEPGFLKPDHIWVPSIGVGGIKFYDGDLFPEWKNSLLIGSLKFQYLSVLKRNGQNFKEEKLIFKNKIGRIRDIEVNDDGEIFLIADEPNTFLYKLTP